MEIPPIILKRLNTLGISHLYPPQEKALNMCIPGKNLLVAIPTAAGKTLIAEILMVYSILFGPAESRGKAIYLTPLKALATEKYHTFKEHWEALGIQVAFSTGDFDHLDQSIFNADIIVMTNEKTDSILRNRPECFQELTCIVADEIHLLNDETRGVTLELVLTKIRKQNPKMQIIGLSATINNAGQLAQWLDATLIQDDWRPVTLKEGAFLDHRIIFADGSEKVVPVKSQDPIESLLIDTILEGGQVLAFLSTRRNAMTAAKKFAQVLKPHLSKEAQESALAMSEEIIKLEAENTPQSLQLADMLRMGVAFHHAGLTYTQRTFVEENFRKHHIWVIAATPTLAAGINTPARRVIIKGLERFSSERGNQEIPVIEYKQMAGRAGRPGFDPYGEAVIIARNPAHLNEVLEKYVRGTPEDISSKLNNESELKSHLLGTIASGFAENWSDITSFFNLTFYNFQTKKGISRKSSKKAKQQKSDGEGSETSEYFKYVTTISKKYEIDSQNNTPREKRLDESLRDALSFLLEQNMVIKNEESGFESYEVTPIGQKVSQLYIKPESAVEFCSALRVISQRIATHTMKLTTLSFLHAISRFPDSYLPYAGEGDKEVLRNFYEKHIDEFVFPRRLNSRTMDLDDVFPELKLCAILYQWIQEVPEERLAENFNVGAGDIHRYVDTAEWLVHAAEVLCSSFNAKKWESGLKRLNIRIKYGCAEDLVPLVSIYDVGRVRARILFKAGYKTPEDVLRAEVADLTKLPTFGPEIVARIKRNLSAGILKSNFLPSKMEQEQKSKNIEQKQRSLF